MTAMNKGEAQGARAPIDIGQLARNTAGDRRLGREVLGVFREQADRYLSTLEGAAEDALAWRAAAHTLKGAARAIGAHEVALLAEHAEGLSGATAGQRRQALVAIRTAVQDARRFIDYQLLDAAH